MNLEIANFIDIVKARALIEPDKTSFIFLQDGETEVAKLTYKELDQQAKAIASQLQSIINPGDAYGALRVRALLLYPPGLDFIAAFFGCLYAGIIAVPAYPPRRNQHQSRLEAIIIDVQPLVVLTTSDLLANISNQLGQNQQLPNLHYITTNNIVSSENFIPYQASPDTLAFVQYTSGSTGIPKGVMITHGNLLYNSQLIQSCFQDTPYSLGVSWLPPYHDMGLIGGVLQPLYVGAPTILMSPVAFIQKPWRWLQAISRYKATTSGGPNFAYELCVKKITLEQKAELDLSNWILAFNGAEPIRIETLERFATAFKSCGFRQEAFYPCYGMAEATLLVSGGLKTSLPSVCQVDKAALEKHQIVADVNTSENLQKMVGCGYARLDQKIAIVDPELQIPCPEGKVGEIWVSGASVAMGYWQQRDLTEQTFNAYLADEGPFLRTGDLGFLQHGELFVTGRIKDLIIIRGCNHYPQDIEQTVQQSHPALVVGSGAAFVVDLNGEQKLVVVQEVERTYLHKLNVQEVVRNIRQAVATEDGIQINTIVLVKTGSLLKTSSGKIQRFACREAFLSGNLQIIDM
ncbi:fatty acyl-AMP ligase [Nostoc sp. DedQUE07]|uniref:fatty acyl-AMP ligase n=1 Tax=Nostoc sp. DedQUE07 TaxID=3075392 RepID=UPI002AD24883|nr:fatty acyl-AMP ligase [Nostoc sp. DedQUE07]MDZ8133528.1 fatty acyl-AMP ligase [Nostoc sp. DedQUE07]